MTPTLCKCGCGKEAVSKHKGRRQAVYASRECYDRRRVRSGPRCGHDPRWYRSQKCGLCSRARRFARLYGIDPEKVLALPNPVFCLICGADFDLDHPPCLDHDHGTKRLRGWLCNRCNAGIAMFDDEPDRLMNAAEYVAQSHWGTKTEVPGDTVVSPVELRRWLNEHS
ncbi:endonuclease VII [Gordonia phage SummitAcademy]|nr:endonuclease VII [Gordonia phage SummitAcademy]